MVICVLCHSVPEGPGKRVVLRTSLSIVPVPEVTAYLFTVLTNYARPLISLYFDKKYEVKTPNQWCPKQGIPFSKSQGVSHVLMITAQSVRYPIHLLISANSRVIVSGPPCPMLLGDSVHHHHHSIHLALILWAL